MIDQRKFHFLNVSSFVVLLLGFLAPDFAFSFQKKIEKRSLRIFILAGQSNMQGHARAISIYKKLMTVNGSVRIFEKVSITYLSSDSIKPGKLTTGFGADERKLGPELTFGISIQEKVKPPVLTIG